MSALAAPLMAKYETARVRIMKNLRIGEISLVFLRLC
jgi:hypothetical protein